MAAALRNSSSPEWVRLSGSLVVPLCEWTLPADPLGAGCVSPQNQLCADQPQMRTTKARQTGIFSVHGDSDTEELETLGCRLFQDNVGDPPWMPGVTTCTTSTANLGRGYGRWPDPLLLIQVE